MRTKAEESSRPGTEVFSSSSTERERESKWRRVEECRQSAGGESDARGSSCSLDEACGDILYPRQRLYWYHFVSKSFGVFVSRSGVVWSWPCPDPRLHSPRVHDLTLTPFFCRIDTSSGRVEELNESWENILVDLPKRVSLVEAKSRADTLPSELWP